MGSRFVSAVALYGPKPDPARGFLASIQALIAEHAGDSFRPYSLEQVHATLIRLTGVPGPAAGTVLNQGYLEHRGIARQMDLAKAMRILASHLARPIAVRIGGHRRDQEARFLSRGQHLFERAFSAQGDAFVLVGWPVAALTGPDRPLDRLRREMNAAGVLHHYHRDDADIDDDFHLVLGHLAGAPAGAAGRAVAAVRDRLAVHPVDLEIGLADVTVVAADSPTLAPARFAGSIPVDERTLRELMA